MCTNRWCLLALAIAFSAGMAGTAWFAFQSPKPVAPPVSKSFLVDTTHDCGIAAHHEPGGPSFFMPEIVGSGVALFDFDRDERLDIYIRSGNRSETDPDAAPQLRSRLFHQESDGRFLDVTEASGLIDFGYGMGVAIGDVNNDGFPDVYTANFGADRLFLNQRDGTFLDITESAGMDNALWASSASFVDYDRDGRLDLFVTNYVDYSNPRPCALASGRVDYCNPKEYPRTPDKLYRNVTELDRAAADYSAVRFEDASESSGIASQHGPGLGVRACDANDDAWPDLFVANDGVANFLWINQRDGTFREMAVPNGVAYNAAGLPLAGMGIAEGDINRDGLLDLVVTNIRAGGHALYRRDGPVFVDGAGPAGLAPATLKHTGFGVALADFNHDGNLDIAIANGNVYQSLDRPGLTPPSREQRDESSVRKFWQAYADTNQVFIGTERGQFQENTAHSGGFGQDLESARGLAIGDLDNDGDLDIVITRIAALARVYSNEFPPEGSWLLLRVIDPKLGDRDAYGAVVRVTAAGREWIGRVQPGSSYQCSNDPRLHFGLGPATDISHMDVQWPDGPALIERFPGGPANTRRTLRRGSGEAVTTP